MSASLRARVANGLSKVVTKGCSLNEVLADFDTLETKDMALARELVFGTLRQYYPLTKMTECLLNKPLKVKDDNIKCLILLGLYQLFFTRIPDHAALSETVQATVKLKKGWAKGLVNALLRTAIRQGDDLFEEVKSTPSTAASLPDWLYQQLETDWPEQLQQIITHCHQKAPLTLRVNIRNNSREQFLRKLEDAGITASKHPLAEQALLLDKSCDIRSLPGYLQGDFSVQDSAAQMAAALLEVRSGQNILDACAAPGGKTSHILELVDNRASVVALDSSANRMKILEENLQRLKLNATTIVADATKSSQWYPGEPFDRILCDAPCSAVGIIRRHPDISVLRRKADIDSLNLIQQTILDTLWPLLKPGGIMVYATCSILKSENSQQIHDFLERNTDAQLSDLQPLDTSLGKDVATLPGWQILPGELNMDGFYYAKLSNSR